METRSHRRLKQLAVAFLREHGCRAAACEVRCPISRYRADVAGWADTTGPNGRSLADEPPPPASANGRERWRRRPPRTVLVECKQSRSDFLRDRRDQQKLLRRRENLERFRRSMEQHRIPAIEPHLRRAGSSLFPELEEWDFTASRLPAYRDVLRQLRQIDRMLHGQTKFWMMARYALADRLYLAAPEGMIRKREIPPGWGLLACPKRALRDDDPNAGLFGESILQVVVNAPRLDPREEYRRRLLRNITVAASWAASNALGVLA